MSYFEKKTHISKRLSKVIIHRCIEVHTLDFLYMIQMNHIRLHHLYLYQNKEGEVMHSHVVRIWQLVSKS